MTRSRRSETNVADDDIADRVATIVSNQLDVEKEKVKPPLKGFVVNGFKIDYTKCMFCALCVDPCPVDCIFMGSTYDQSCFSRDGCIVDFAKLPLETAWGQASLNPTAIAASKLAVEPVWVKKPEPAAATEPPK